MIQGCITLSLAGSFFARPSRCRFRLGVLALLLITSSTSFPAEKDAGKSPVGIKRLARELRKIPDTIYFELRQPLYSTASGALSLEAKNVAGAGHGHSIPQSGNPALRRNLVTVSGYEGVKYSAVDIPGGCAARVNGAKVFPKEQQIVVIMQAKLVTLHPKVVRAVRRSLSPKGEQWATDFLKSDRVRITCERGEGGRAEVFDKAGTKIRKDSMITFSFAKVEEGQLARGFCTMWAHVVSAACPLDEAGKAIR